MSVDRSHLARRGVAGTLGLVLAVLAALNINRLPLVGDNDVLHVQFAEAGGLTSGDAVLVSGAQVGKVRRVRIDGDRVVADVVIHDHDLEVGRLTRAKIVTTTLLGRAAVQLEPEGAGDLVPGGTIPLERTSSPYNLTSTLNELTTTTASIDKRRLAAALDQTASVLGTSSDQIGPALQGMTALSSAVSANDTQLVSLVQRTSRVTGVLAGRNGQLASLLGAGRSLLTQLYGRRRVVVALLHSAVRVSAELRLTLRDTDGILGPSLRELDRVVRVLNRNRANLQASITGLQGYTTGVGESLASGPWFDIYIQNLTSPGTVAPILSGATQ